MGSVAYVRQVWLDVDWSTKADAIYQKNPRGVARPRYDRTNAVLAEALEDHAVVLIPANNSSQIRRAFGLAERWHVNGVLYGGPTSYEGASGNSAKKVPLLGYFKWSEGAKDADTDDVSSQLPPSYRDLAAP